VDTDGVPPPVSEEASDFSAFLGSVTALDDAPGRSASAAASQDTTVDSSDPNVTSVDTSGEVSASWFDDDAGDGDDPAGESTSEFTVTFEVSGEPAVFSLTGSIAASADAANADCTTVIVTSPTGAIFSVGAPEGCGSPGLSVQDEGELAVGTHVFSVVASAVAANPSATGGGAEASFGLNLRLGVCTVTGTEGDDQLVGDAAVGDIMCGLGGDDDLKGLGGNDTIFGGPGGDTVEGGAGNDVISGEGGADVLRGGNGADVINGDEGGDTIDGGLGNDIPAGGNGEDLIVGDDLVDCAEATSAPGLNDDEIFGGSGHDIIWGCQGADKIHGEGGDDFTDGNQGDDVLLGDQGSDKLRGRAGADTLTGGTRKDVLVGGSGNDALFARDGVLDVVRGGGGSNDEAQVDEDLDEVTGVEVLLA